MILLHVCVSEVSHAFSIEESLRLETENAIKAVKVCVYTELISVCNEL